MSTLSREGTTAIKKSKYRVLCAIFGDGTGLSVSLDNN